jgi:hypothetical protein
MSSIGTGYDLSTAQFSPDGRVFQIEYAMKAVENSGTAIAIRVKDGVVFAVQKIITSKLHERGTNRRISTIDEHVGVVRYPYFPCVLICSSMACLSFSIDSGWLGSRCQEGN